MEHRFTLDESHRWPIIGYLFLPNARIKLIVLIKWQPAAKGRRVGLKVTGVSYREIKKHGE